MNSIGNPTASPLRGQSEARSEGDWIRRRSIDVSVTPLFDPDIGSSILIEENFLAQMDLVP